MLTRPGYLPGLAFVLLILGLTGCSGANTASEPQSRSYSNAFDQVITVTAEATKDAGLSIESAEEIQSGLYQIIASKYERLRGEREPIRVADVSILIKLSSSSAVTVDIEQEKLTRTSTIGTSNSAQIDYPRRIYKRIERRLSS